MKKIVCAIFSIGVVLGFISCNWQIPETVSVKTNAEYNFSIGTFQKDLSESMNLSSMMGDSGSGTGDIKKYDYFPGQSDKNTQHFLLEVKVKEFDLLAAQSEDAVNAAFPDASSISLGSLTGAMAPNTSLGAGNKCLEFNPSEILSGMKSALGEEMADKISFASVPVYLYCEAPENITATAEISVFYDVNDTCANKKGEVELLKQTNQPLNTPKPAFPDDGSTVTTNLDTTVCLSKKDITKLINGKEADGTALSLTENDKLYVSYNFGAIGGTVTKQEIIDGLKLTLYAVIDMPLRFKVSPDEDVILDLTKMTKGDGSSSSGSSDPQSSGSENEELSEYLKVIDSIDIRYVAYQLPMYSESGMKLGFDLLGNNDYQWESISVKPKGTSIESGSKFSLKQETVVNMKDLGNFNPSIKLKMEKGSIFSIPREKAVEMKIEMGLKTNGAVKVM